MQVAAAYQRQHATSIVWFKFAGGFSSSSSGVHVKQQGFIQQLRSCFGLITRHATAGIFTADLRTSRSFLSVCDSQIQPSPTWPFYAPNHHEILWPLCWEITRLGYQGIRTHLHVSSVRYDSPDLFSPDLKVNVDDLVDTTVGGCCISIISGISQISRFLLAAWPLDAESRHSFSQSGERIKPGGSLIISCGQEWMLSSSILFLSQDVLI